MSITCSESLHNLHNENTPIRFQSDLNQSVQKLNRIFIDTSQETFGSKIF